MSATESEFVFLTTDDLEAARAPRADRAVEPDERVESFAYKCGVIELRSANPGEHLNSTHGIVNLRDHR